MKEMRVDQLTKEIISSKDDNCGNDYKDKEDNCDLMMMKDVLLLSLERFHAGFVMTSLLVVLTTILVITTITTTTSNY